ncbi:SCO family protein [Labrys monachus]|uniref:Protein SCO1/2 n=1 Tax=Labrys monachus TaxID=217067 RepID=A0ABU0FDB3_9HYPH|nr:SCO family protein [Labrys monachus]MDQ0392575.1 protein SCO1/2 [Labrys monachus]
MPSFTRREWLAAAGGVLAIAMAGVWHFWPQEAAPAGPVGGPFALVDDDGLPFTFRDLLGKPSLVYFGFTRCPDICPTTLFQLSEVLSRLGPDADRINALFITVDPDRDTPAQMKSYLAAFDPHLRGLTGDRAHLAVAWEVYGVSAMVVPTTSDNYNMNHTSTVFVLDRNARFATSFDMHEAPDDAVALVRDVLASRR